MKAEYIRGGNEGETSRRWGGSIRKVEDKREVRQSVEKRITERQRQYKGKHRVKA